MSWCTINTKTIKEIEWGRSNDCLGKVEAEVGDGSVWGCGRWRQQITLNTRLGEKLMRDNQREE